MRRQCSGWRHAELSFFLARWSGELLVPGRAPEIGQRDSSETGPAFEIGVIGRPITHTNPCPISPPACLVTCTGVVSRSRDRPSHPRLTRTPDTRSARRVWAFDFVHRLPDRSLPSRRGDGRRDATTTATTQ